MLPTQLFITLCAIALPLFALPQVEQRQVQLANSTINSTSGSTGAGLSDEIVAAAWYPGWLSAQLPVDQISWSKYNTMTFSFATTTNDPSVISLDDSSVALLPTFVSEARKHNVTALLSIGGWTGSKYFSSAVSTVESRTKFANAILELAKKYDLDGIDFDWEYPGKQGIGCNEISGDDSTNFLSLLQEIRKDTLGSQLLLTAAVGQAPFAGSDGIPMADVSAFAKALDFIAIMAYDIWGAWSPTIGPNAPLYDTCNTDTSKQAGSGASSVESWSKAGFPANQIALGVASYGRAYTVAADQASKIGEYPTFTDISLGESDTGETSTDSCGNVVGNSGLYDFNGLIKAGFLSKDGSVATGNTYHFDNCSQTPFVYSPTRQAIATYDDAASFAAKGEYAAEKGLKGFAMWHVAGDSDDILLDAIRQALGLKQ